VVAGTISAPVAHSQGEALAPRWRTGRQRLRLRRAFDAMFHPLAGKMPKQVLALAQALTGLAI
jgi:hypothetical protein